MRRRSFLGGGAALTVVFAAGQVLRVHAQGGAEIKDGIEYEPWRTWQQDSQQGPLAFVRAAILAGSAFNAQPWLFKVTKSRVELYADLKRNLGKFDPYLRDMHLSLGCALENLVLAAAAGGYRTSLTIMPGRLQPTPENPHPVMVARADFAPADRANSELYEAIPHRHTTREKLDGQKPLPPDFPSCLLDLAANDNDVKLFLFSGDAERRRLAEIIDRAGITNLADADIRAGIQPWLRTSEAQMRKLRDGVLAIPDKPGPRSSGSYVDFLLSGRLFGIIAVRDRYERAQTLRAGRLWQRCHLLITARGLAARPENSAVELIDHERRLDRKPQCLAQLAQVTGDPKWQPTLMFYTGYATTPTEATPRRPLADVQL